MFCSKMFKCNKCCFFLCSAVVVLLHFAFNKKSYDQSIYAVEHIQSRRFKIKKEDTRYGEIQRPQHIVHMNIPSPHVPYTNCEKLATGDITEIKRAETYQKNNQQYLQNHLNLYITKSNCTLFKNERQYVMKPLSQEEAEFPIAYNILMYKDPDQVERLLRAIYRLNITRLKLRGGISDSNLPNVTLLENIIIQTLYQHPSNKVTITKSHHPNLGLYLTQIFPPQNYYCIHIDKKSSGDTFAAMRFISSCFDNVFLASKSIDVQWGFYSVLEPELVCIEDLWKYKKWKYLINLTGQEFPLKTNLDIVKILKALNGANSVHSTIKGLMKERTEFVYPSRKHKKAPPPVNVTLTKGAVHVMLKRAFVDYLLHNKTALLFRDWVKDTGHPDETFFNSLNHSPQLNVPGAYKGTPENSPKYPGLSRVKNWHDGLWKCQGKISRHICIFGVGDLQYLMNKTKLFANKFHKDFHPLAYDCLEEIHFNMTREEVLGRRIFDVSFYKQLDVSHNHVT